MVKVIVKYNSRLTWCECDGGMQESTRSSLATYILTSQDFSWLQNGQLN